jgi:hypothetical protein
MSHIDDASPEAFKWSVLNVIKWTEATIGDRLRFVCEQCYINEDAGVLFPLRIVTYRKPGAVVAWLELPVGGTGYADYKNRFNEAARRLGEEFHVEQSEREGDRDNLFVLRLSIRHEYDRPV